MPYDLAVVGSGVMGAAVAWQAATYGLRTVLIDRHPAPHDHGSSHGQTRLLRIAYAEGERYVPLARRAAEMWKDLGLATGQAVFHQSGVIYTGQRHSDLICGVRHSAAAHGVPLHEVAPDERQRLAPELHTPEDWPMLIEEEGGYLLAEDAVRAMLTLGAQTGRVTLRTGEVKTLAADRRGISVTMLDGDDIRARQAVLAAGPWTQDLLPATGLRLEVRRQVMHWFEGPAQRFGTGARFRPFAANDQSKGTFFYGFPRIDGLGIKVADHYDGTALAHANQRKREIEPADVEATQDFVRQCLPRLGSHLQSRTCFYTCTPSEHFVLDWAPGWDRVYVCGGFSGHGFKFAPAIGEAVAQILRGDGAALDLSPFRWPSEEAGTAY